MIKKNLLYLQVCIYIFISCANSMESDLESLCQELGAVEIIDEIHSAPQATFDFINSISKNDKGKIKKFLKNSDINGSFIRITKKRMPWKPQNFLLKGISFFFNLHYTNSTEAIEAHKFRHRFFKPKYKYFIKEQKTRSRLVLPDISPIYKNMWLSMVPIMLTVIINIMPTDTPFWKVASAVMAPCWAVVLLNQQNITLKQLDESQEKQ